MIDEARLKKAFVKVKDEFNYIKWQMIGLQDRLDDVTKEIRTLGGDTTNAAPRMERPLIEPVKEKVIEPVKEVSKEAEPKAEKSVETKVEPEVKSEPVVETKPPTPMSDEEEFY